MGKLRALWKKDPGLVVSGGAHVAALVLILVNFSSAPKFDDAVETVPVDMITTSDLNQIMNGEKTAKQMEKSQRVVDKVADIEDHKPAPPVPEAKKDTPPPPSPDKANADPGADDKPSEKTAALPPPPPVAPPPPVPTPPVPTPPERPVEQTEAPTPPPKPEMSKPDEAKPEPKEAEAVEPPPRPKVEPKKEPKKEPPKKVAKQAKKLPVPRPVEDAKVVPDPPKRPDPPQPQKPDLKQRTLDQVAKLLDTLKPEKPKPEPPVKQRSGSEVKDAKPNNFSFDKITAFLDHDAPQRTASTGQQLTKLASLGSPTAHAEKMSPSMMARIDGWLIDHYRGCWSYFGLGATADYVPRVHVRMAPDGSLIGRPALLNPPNDPNLRSLADSAVRAVNKCDPLPIPEWFKAHYETWRDRTVRFDPKEMS